MKRKLSDSFLIEHVDPSLLLQAFSTDQYVAKRIIFKVPKRLRLILWQKLNRDNVLPSSEWLRLKTVAEETDLLSHYTKEFSRFCLIKVLPMLLNFYTPVIPQRFREVMCIRRSKNPWFYDTVGGCVCEFVWNHNKAAWVFKWQMGIDLIKRIKIDGYKFDTKYHWPVVFPQYPSFQSALQGYIHRNEFRVALRCLSRVRRRLPCDVLKMIRDFLDPVKKNK